MVQSGLAWAIQTTSHSIYSSSDQGQTIWTHFCCDSMAHKAHLYVHSQWAPGMCLSGRELSRFKGRRHNTIYLFSLYTKSFHQHVYFIFTSLLNLGFCQLGFRYKNRPQITSLRPNVELFRLQPYAKQKNMIYTHAWQINSLKLLLLQVQVVM